MSRYSVAKAARRALDQRLQHVDMEAMAPPRGGWVKSVRLALDMSSADLGSRMGVSRQAIAALEASERARTVRLESLERAAAAMDCRLVYALVPNTTLQGTVEAEAGRVVDALVASVTHTMALEDQSVQLSAASRADHGDDVVRSGRLLWGPAR